MKNTHIIIESSFTYVVLLYQQKKSFIKKKFKRMVIEMLFNGDIQLFFVQMILKFSKGNKCNYVHY
jgi:hypothetical protein